VSGRRKTYPEGIRITRVGFWFVAFSLVVAVAATNTGNNALYLVLAAMLALFVVSGVISRGNLRRLGIRIDVPDEWFANRPASVRFEVANEARFVPRWLIVLSLSHARSHVFLPFLAAGRDASGRIDVMMTRRGLHLVRFAHLWSVFPLGFFRKGLRYRLDREILVYPELFPKATAVSERHARLGEEATPEKGWGHELHSLREFRPGDDPRSIHWKRTASSGEMVFMERQSEEGRRLSIVFDNAVGRLRDEVDEQRFEMLVSEAATAVHQYVLAGFEVELVTRGPSLGFGTGLAHRRRLLEQLALIDARPASRAQLAATDPGAPEIRLAMRREEAA
jgi:uncharacterized protein (DUF58 family)